jgi:hypothetical protein
MKQEHASSTPQPEADSHRKNAAITLDASLRKWVTWFGVTGTGLLGTYFFDLPDCLGRVRPNQLARKADKQPLRRLSRHTDVSGYSVLYRVTSRGDERPD